MTKISLLLITLLLGYLASFAASELTFDSSAEPTSLILDDESMLGNNSGFFLTLPDGSTVQLNSLSQSGDEITVSRSGRSEEFTFLVQSYDHHVAIHLVGMDGLGGVPEDYSLQLRLFSPSNLQIQPYTLNNMLTSAAKRAYVYLTWADLWGRLRADGSHGSVVLYNNTLSGSSRDEALAEIWSIQAAQGHMVKPNVDSWTESDIMDWIDWYVKSFEKLSTISVHPENDADDLYEMVNRYVIPHKPTKVFMFQTSWGQGSDYTTPRASIFPNGETDLRAYSDYLEANGIMLHLKNMTPQVKPNMSGEYITATHVDDRIMAWSNGTLNGNISSSDTEIEFHGEVNLGYEDWETNWKWETEYFRIGNEIVRATTVTNPSDGVWVLSGCLRGQKETTASSHSTGDKMLGLVSKWNNLNYQEDFDQDNSLGEELIGSYAEFMVRMNSRHIHFDGTGLNNPIWYTREYTDYAYSKYPYPTTGSTVGGGGLTAHFEKQFSQVQEIIGMLNYFPVRIAARLHQTGRSHTETSTSKLEMNFDISDGIRLGSRRVAFLAGESASKLTKTTLDAWGLTEYAFQLFAYWKELAPVLTDEDVAYISTFLTAKYKNHYKSPDVLMLSKRNDGNYIFTPHRVMARTSGVDTVFVVDQEWSGIAPWQYMTTGTTMELENPYDQQQIQVMMWVDENSSAVLDPLFTVNNSGTLSVTGSVQPMEYMNYLGGDTVAVYDKDWNFLRSLPAVANNFIANNGTLTIKTETGSGSVVSDIKTQFVTRGPEYELTTNAVLDSIANIPDDNVTVTGIEITPNQSSLDTENMSVQRLFATVSPFNAGNQDIVWTSSDNTLATVSEDGVVTALAGGYVTITATTVDGGFSDNCTIYIYQPPSNLALNGAASQSSTAHEGDASLAIDGNTNGIFNKNSVTHTDTEDDPWWQVDLGEDNAIGEINIFGRTDDCCADRLTDYTLYIINSAGETVYSEHFTEYPTATTNAGGVEGQIVKIVLNGNTALSLAEVEVFQAEQAQPDPCNAPHNGFSTIQAEDYCEMSGIQIEDNINGVGSQHVAYVNNGDYIRFGTVNFDAKTANSVSVRIGSKNTGGNIEIRSGSNTGELLGTIPVAATGSWATWETVSANIEPLTGTHDLYFVFTGESGYLFNLNWIEFSEETVAEIQTIALKEGWNLVSLYLDPDMCTGAQPCVSTVFPNATIVKTFDSFYSNSQADFLNTLTEIEAGAGYVVYNEIDETITISGVQTQNVAPPLSEGWNLIGVSSSVAVPVTDFPDAQIIKDFESFYEKGNTLNSLQMLEPGKAYFILR